MEIGCGKRTEGSSAPEQTKEWVDGEQRVSHHHRSTIHFPPVTPYLLSPPPLSSTVACNFKFHFPRLSLLVSSALEGPLNRVFQRFPTLIHLACLSISIRYLFYQFTSGCTRVARPGNSCSVARLTTPRRNFEEEKERERGRGTVFDRFLFLSRFVPSSSSKRTETVGNFQPASSAKKFLLRAELCTGTVHNVYIRTVGGGGSVRSGKEIFKRGVVVHHPSTFSPVASCPPPLLLLLLLPLYGWKGESTIVDRLEKHPRRKRNWRILNISRCNKARHATDRLRY